MNTKTCALAVTALWAFLTVFAWFSPAKELSEAERRPLAQMPGITAQNLLDGDFMEDFADYAVDQFPLRETFRQLKSLFHLYGIGQQDKNGLYLADGHVAEMLYPMDEQALSGNLSRLQLLYDTYLKDSDCRIFSAVIPHKGYYLAGESGHLSLDFDRLTATVGQALPWAETVPLADCLDASSYYATDLHWKQEALFPVAQRLCQTLGVTSPKTEDFVQTPLERPFYGVYYGQMALPMKPDTLRLLENDLLKNCTVYDHESGKTTAVYNMEKLDSKDLYDVYLSGARSLLTIENPMASSDRELVLIRDSFSSSLAPLLLQDYAKVTLVDIRYLSTENLGRFLDFDRQDVLILYSANVLNTPGILR